MNDRKQREAAAKFATDWQGKGYEKGQSQAFWLTLLHDVYGVDDPAQYISFENQVKLDHTSFIDGYIATTKVLIEQKSLGKDLRAPIKQSDGSFLTPFQQAKRYAAEIPYSQRPRYIITCNFESFLVYDMERPNDEPQEILLSDLERDYHRLNFLVKTNIRIQCELEVSIKAGELIGKLYEAILKQYKDPTSEDALKSLNVLCVRLVFCMYAEDAGIFGERNMFLNYLHEFDARRLRGALIDLFKVLDTEAEKRDPYLDDMLAAFPYVNGGLFADEDIVIPQFTDEIRELLLDKASSDFDWNQISPTIFGALFESTLNPVTRRSGGMHYTSIENIHKVIDPLFLDELKAELMRIKEMKVKKAKKAALLAYQEKLAGLTFLDPACGSGNFLTETYLSLRHLENEMLREYYDGEIVMGILDNPIKVSIQQFYGIEINDFAVTVAKTALWIAESQMMKETEDVMHMDLDFLPLKSYVNIVEGNALRLDWKEVVPKEKLNYIMGNPPFVGYSLQSKEQKANILSVYVDEKGKPYKTAGKIDYVAGWYFKASSLMHGTNIRTAFVSTNSITQGEQVAAVWKPLYERFGIHIDFAWRTFKWESEATIKAAVHVVIVGFGCGNGSTYYLYSNNTFEKVENINPYLLNAPTIFVESRKKPIADVCEMMTGNRPADGGHLIIEGDDYHEFITREPQAKQYIKKFMGSLEFINNKARYCLWLVGVTPSELKKCPRVLERVKLCREDRLNAKDVGRQKLADRAMLFRETNNPKQFIVVPKVSSENRRYIPIGLLDDNVIVSDLLFFIPMGDMFALGLLMSNVHMAWMRTVAGRLKSDYRYSKDIVYNNFPWCEPTEAQRAKIEKTAQGILDARALYPDSSLADLYDEATMPIELRKAHRANDKAVMEAYGFWGKLNSESECVAELMKMYQQLTEEL